MDVSWLNKGSTLHHFCLFLCSLLNLFIHLSLPFCTWSLHARTHSQVHGEHHEWLTSAMLQELWEPLHGSHFSTSTPTLPSSASPLSKHERTNPSPAHRKSDAVWKQYFFFSPAWQVHCGRLKPVPNLILFSASTCHELKSNNTARFSNCLFLSCHCYSVLLSMATLVCLSPSQVRKLVFLPPTISLSEWSPSAQSNSFSEAPVSAASSLHIQSHGDGNKMGTGWRGKWRYRRNREKRRARKWNFTIKPNAFGCTANAQRRRLPTHGPYLTRSSYHPWKHTYTSEEPNFTMTIQYNCNPNSDEVNTFSLWR